MEGLSLPENRLKLIGDWQAIVGKGFSCLLRGLCAHPQSWTCQEWGHPAPIFKNRILLSDLCASGRGVAKL